jgi:hypothetical protein
MKKNPYKPLWPMYKWIGKWLRADRQRAEAAVAYAFPNHTIRKIRKDAGIKKGENNEHI